MARVVAGGRRFSFSVAVITGNRKGLVGVGIGKAGDTALAIDKAVRNAKKNMITVRLTKKMSIPHEVECKFSSARIIIRPAPGKGVIAGSVARYVIDLAGIKDVSAKILSVSKNPLNIARATIAALEKSANLTRPRHLYRLKKRKPQPKSWLEKANKKLSSFIKNMQTHNIKRKNPNYKSARVGRGGKRGKTSGRGTKGQNARAGRKKRPEMRDIIKKLPKLRGYRFNTIKKI